MIVLPVKSENFPSGGPSAQTTISFTKAQLCWAALTVGKRFKADVRSHGVHSTYEARFRWNMVLSALDFSTNLNRATNSNHFDAMDPTEKGGINFYLGMIFLKLCAHKLLDIPMLVHLHWMKTNHDLTLLSGRSSPDLLGFDTTTYRWSVFEAKGRNAGFSQAILDKAKGQSNRLIYVDGDICSLHVGSILYRDNYRQLEFEWEDPVPDEEEPIELETDRETWLEYYLPIYNLYLEQNSDRRAFRRVMGFNVTLHRKTRKLIEAIKRGDDYYKEIEAFIVWSAAQMKAPKGDWNGDGIGILIDEDW